jgi:hypothetical protein
MDELRDIGPEDPDWDYVPPELRAADGQVVNVKGEQVLPDGFAEALAETDACAEEMFGATVVPDPDPDGRDGTLCVFPEFFADAARRRREQDES